MKFLCPALTHLTRPKLNLVNNMYLYFKDSYMYFISRFKLDLHKKLDKAWIGKKNATQNPPNLTHGSSMKY